MQRVNRVSKERWAIFIDLRKIEGHYINFIFDDNQP